MTDTAATAEAPGTVPNATVPALASPVVLCVDDEPNILSALTRVLRGAGCTVRTVPGGAEALALLEQQHVDIVISDMRMPGMDGAALLERVHARWPQAIRILLTGHADMSSTVAAINRGRIFRYVGKPWDEHELLGAVIEGAERLALERETIRLQALTKVQNEELRTLNSELESRVAKRTAELRDANDRLKKSYLKSIKVFSNLLELRSGQLAGHGRRVAEQARDIARQMNLSEEAVLEVFVAGLLHDIGLIGLADKLLTKPVARYSAEELVLYHAHPAVGEQSLLALDDMQPLLPIIRAHHERWDGKGFPERLAGEAIPVAARILAIADTYDDLRNGHLADSQLSVKEARVLMRNGRGTQFDPEILDVFLHITEPAAPGSAPAQAAAPSLVMTTPALEPDMVLARDLVSNKGILMLTAGHRLTPSLIRKIREFEQREGGRLEVHIKPKSQT